MSRGQTIARIAWDLMRVEKREFVWEFFPLSHSGQWELTSESLYESFHNSHAQAKREHEVNQSCSELRSYTGFHERFLNSYVLVKREQELHVELIVSESDNLHGDTRTRWELMGVEKPSFVNCMWESSQLSWFGQTKTRVGERWSEYIACQAPRITKTLVTSLQNAKRSKVVAPKRVTVDVILFNSYSHWT